MSNISDQNSPDSGTWHVVTDEAGFQALEAEWHTLFLSNPRHRPFQAWGWVKAWLAHLAGEFEYRVICRRDATDKLQFVLPLIESNGAGRYRSKRLMSICGFGPDCSDHASCLRAPSLNPQIAELVAAAISRVASDHTGVQLGNLDSFDGFATELSASVRGNGRLVRLIGMDVCPVVALTDSWDSYLKLLSSNFRSQVRRHFKRIENHETVHFRTFDNAAGANFANELIRLNRGRIDEKGEVSSLEDPRMRRFLREAIPAMATSGLAWMDVVEDDGVIVAASLNLVHGETAYYYMGGFDARSNNLRPGTALFARVLQRCIERGISRYDFLRGSDRYKYRWGAEDAAIYMLDIYPRSLLKGASMYAVDGLTHVARTTVRQLRTKFRQPN